MGRDEGQGHSKGGELTGVKEGEGPGMVGTFWLRLALPIAPSAVTDASPAHRSSGGKRSCAVPTIAVWKGLGPRHL